MWHSRVFGTGNHGTKRSQSNGGFLVIGNFDLRTHVWFYAVR